MTLVRLFPMTLRDILGIELSTDTVVTCFAKTKKNERCRHPISRDKVKEAHQILCAPIIYPEHEDGAIKKQIERLSILLVNGTIHMNERASLEAKWLNDVESQIDEYFELLEIGEMSYTMGEPSWLEPDTPSDLEISEIDNVGPLNLPTRQARTETEAIISEVEAVCSVFDTALNIVEISEESNTATTISNDSGNGSSHAASAEVARTSVQKNSTREGTTELNHKPSIMFSNAIRILLICGQWICSILQIEYGTVLLRDAEGRLHQHPVLGVKFMISLKLPLLDNLPSSISLCIILLALYILGKYVLGSYVAYLMISVLCLYFLDPGMDQSLLRRRFE